MDDPWAAAGQLVGRWEGPATGRPGVGRQVREYRPILRGRFLLGTNTTVWEPTAEEPDGNNHEDLSVVGLDRSTGQLFIHGFHVEGFVHDYRCIEADPDGSRLVFQADQVAGGPPGMRARETLRFEGPDVLESTFELAMPGSDFEPYTHELLRRARG